MRISQVPSTSCKDPLPPYISHATQVIRIVIRTALKLLNLVAFAWTTNQLLATSSCADSLTAVDCLSDVVQLLIAVIILGLEDAAVVALETGAVEISNDRPGGEVVRPGRNHHGIARCGR